jgi:hypothetical protein
MDPDETLRRMRELSQILLSGDMSMWACIELAVKAEALDEWLSRGGNLPADWNKSG